MSLFFSDSTQTGFVTWPYARDETQGYITQSATGVIDLVPQGEVFHDKLPTSMRRAGRTVIGTFHSHPDGCRGNKCFYQPPSIQDLKSLRKLALGPLGLTFHIIVTARKLFVITTFPSRSGALKTQFNQLISMISELKDKDLEPEIQEQRWMAIARKFPTVLEINTIPL